MKNCVYIHKRCDILDSLPDALYDIETGSGDSNEEEPVPEPEPADKKNKKDITNPTAKKPCSCGKLIKGFE